MATYDHYATIAELRFRLGMVIPVWYNPAESDEAIAGLLRLTLADSARFLPLNHVVLVVDGSPRLAQIVQAERDHLAHQEEAAPELILEEENRGKEHAVTRGMQWLLQHRPGADLLCVRDADADHFINDLPNLARAAVHIAREAGHPRVLIIGRRSSLHRPMGWLRGELELLQDWVLLDALRFYLARRGEALDLRFCAGPGTVPDFNSGYKLYTRAAAERIFADPSAEMRCLGPDEFWRCGAETVSVVHGVLSGATLGEVQRMTFDGQPTSTFSAGAEARRRWYSGVLAWIFCRLDVPLEAAQRILDNYVTTSSMRTLGSAAEELLAIRGEALERLAMYYGQMPPRQPPARPIPFL
ncbi:MAG: hypothetical protein RML36_04790 [Anaerolineae bacterium]|nr:hypothetical protein [Anaerolineae bacterium]MDW8098790.1 hypothetical protein [Anaerolineae bacterium]